MDTRPERYHAYCSTNTAMNPIQRPTGWRTYFQAIWDTINLSDFGLEIWLAIKFFFNFLRGKEGTRSQPTKMQQTCVVLESRWCCTHAQVHAGYNSTTGEDSHGIVRFATRSASFGWIQAQSIQRPVLAVSRQLSPYRGRSDRTGVIPTSAAHRPGPCFSTDVRDVPDAIHWRVGLRHSSSNSFREANMARAASGYAWLGGSRRVRITSSEHFAST